MGLSAVFALCVRSTARYLPGVLANLDALGRCYDRCAFVFVENDSEDDTRARLRAWTAQRPEAHLIELDGLDVAYPKRTDRLAACRNAYIDFIRNSPCASYDHLVMLDADEVNFGPIDLEGFVRGRDWLVQTGAAAVFANSLPFYYDIYALRHPQWCPRNMLKEVNWRPDGSDLGVARQRFVYDRQIPIPTTAEPVEVRSAFGGLAIYRMADALAGARYVGLNKHGAQVCEHVSFNRALVRAGKRLFILPWMTVGWDRAALAAQERSALSIHQGGRECRIVASPNHRLNEAQQLYVRRLPALAALVSQAAPAGVAIEVGADVGQAVAACRLEGAGLRFVAVEASLSRFKYLLTNCRQSPDLFDGVNPVWSYVGRQKNDEAPPPLGAGWSVTTGTEPPAYARAPCSTVEGIFRSAASDTGDLSLLRLRTRGFDHEILADELPFLSTAAPVVWARARAPGVEEKAAWARLLAEAAGVWPHVLAFDSLGSPLLAGGTADRRRALLDLIGDGRMDDVEVALFPERFAEVFEAFRALLPDLAEG